MKMFLTWNAQVLPSDLKLLNAQRRCMICFPCGIEACRRHDNLDSVARGCMLQIVQSSRARDFCTCYNVPLCSQCSKAQQLLRPIRRSWREWETTVLKRTSAASNCQEETVSWLRRSGHSWAANVNDIMQQTCVRNQEVKCLPCCMHSCFPMLYVSYWIIANANNYEKIEKCVCF